MRLTGGFFLVWAGVLAVPAEVRAQTSLPPSFPLEEKEPLFVIGRGGAGADSNVLRDPDSSTRGALLRGDVRGEWEPITGLRLLADGVFEGDIASTPDFIYETQSGLIATYRKDFLDVGSLTLGSFTEYAREPSVFLAGRVIASGAALRTQFVERLTPMFALALGPVDVEAGARGEFNHVEGLEQFNELGIEAMGGIRAIVLPRRLALRVRYTYGRQNYSGLPARNLMGDVLTPSEDVRLAIHGIRGTARFHPISQVTAALHFDQEWIQDRLTGFLSGNRQRGRVEVFLEFGPLSTEIAGEMTFRNYTSRMPIVDVSMNGIEFSDPKAETTLDAWVDTDVWVSKYFGIYFRYQIQRLWADPTGVLFLRHLVSVGPSLRYDAGAS